MSQKFTQLDADRINAKTLAGKIKRENHIQNRDPLPNPEQCQRQKALEGDCGREAPLPGLLHVRFTLHRKKLLDIDAKYASVKYPLDFLAICGIISGDREGQITLEVNQRKIKKGEIEQTEIEVMQ